MNKRTKQHLYVMLKNIVLNFNFDQDFQDESTIYEFIFGFVGVEYVTEIDILSFHDLNRNVLYTEPTHLKPSYFRMPIDD